MKNTTILEQPDNELFFYLSKLKKYSEMNDGERKGALEQMKSLIEKGANVNAVDNSGATPLHNAASIGHIDIVKLLIEKGANVNAVNKRGYTPLMIALWNGHKEIIESLIKNGANVNAVDNIGKTPLSLARQHKEYNKEVIKLLRENGARDTVLDYIVDYIVDFFKLIIDALASLGECLYPSCCFSNSRINTSPTELKK